jgi:menaquinone-dependent protoporphyrinogen oxidase
MPVLVAHASRHGATAGIAERIAARLRSRGLAAEARSVKDVRDLQPYDAFVVGGAAYMFHWLKEATGFVHRHRERLAAGPTWVFSSGPLGTDLVDEQGRDIYEATRPREFAEITTTIRPRGERVFFGAWDAAAPPVGMAERLMRLMPAARDALPSGDFRDWPAIDAWADEIADALGAAKSAASPPGVTPP